MKQTKLQGHLAIFAANVIFGLGVPVSKALLNDWVTPMGYMASRSFFAAVIFWLIAAFLPSEKVERRDLWVILGGGLLGFVISQSLTAWALDYTTPVYFSLIAALTPVAVMLMAALFISERITLVKLLGVVLGIGFGALKILLRSKRRQKREAKLNPPESAEETIPEAAENTETPNTTIEEATAVEERKNSNG